MKCKFEHSEVCCNSGSTWFKLSCQHEDCGNIVPITNADRIRAMSDEDLAKNNVRLSYQCDIDYNYEEEPYENWMQYYETSDGSTFYEEEDAVEYELDWLRQPAEG